MVQGEVAMLQVVTGVLIGVVAAGVVRRLVGIRRGRWTTTLLALFVANAAAIEVLRIVYGNIGDVPGRALVGAWALVTVFAVLGVLVVELLVRQRVWRPRGGIPHPVRATRAAVSRVLRYMQVGRIWIHRGLVHRGDDPEVAGSRLGRSLRLSFEEAGGLFVKLGQAMALQPQLVTPAVAAELAPLQESAAPADLEAARAVIATDLGRPDEVFADFASEPLGAASIAQTYLARLRDSREVVVKVQRPGVAEAIERDLDIVLRLADRFDRRTAWARSIGLKELVIGFGERTREELDFRIEAANEAAAAKATAESGVVRVPAVIEGLCTQRVLVEERAPGRSVGSRDAFAGWDDARRRVLADGLFALMLRQMLSGEPFHADPHPGNVFVRPDGLLELIDFGAVGRLDAYERAAFLDLLRGVQNQEPTLVREGLLRIAAPAGTVDDEALDRELARLLSRSFRPDGRLSPKLFEDLLFVLRDFQIVLPRSTTTLLRTFVTLLGTLEIIAPGFRVMDAAQRLSGELASVLPVPHSFRELVADQAARNAHIIERLPREVDGLVRVLRKGDLRARVRLWADDEDVRVARGMVNRAAMAVIASALSLASAFMLSAGSASALHGVRIVNLLGGVGLFFGVLLLLRLVIQIVREGG
jgi:ubiquinone biosynthesis protein